MLYPNLTTERMTLRQPEPRDLEAVFRGLSHPDVIKHYGIAYRSKEEARAQMDWYAYVWENEEGVYWMMADSENRRFIGAVGLYHWMQPNRKAELGFWLMPEFWGKGYMREALAPVLKYGFGTMDLNRMEALVEQGNADAGKLLTGAGFTHEGTLRECELKERDDAFISLEMYGLLRREYKR